MVQPRVGAAIRWLTKTWPSWPTPNGPSFRATRWTELPGRSFKANRRSTSSGFPFAEDGTYGPMRPTVLIAIRSRLIWLVVVFPALSVAIDLGGRAAHELFHSLDA